MFGFVSGVAVGAFGYWYFDEGPGVRHLGLARDRVAHEAGRAAGSLKEKFSGFATNDIHVVVDGELSVRRGHDIAHEVKDRLLTSPHRINDVTVHVEPAGD